MVWNPLQHILASSGKPQNERRLHERSKHWKKPNHIGIILDGNRRFAREHALASIVDGHRRGADKIRQVLDWCVEYDTKVITIWIFSLENFGRSDDEVSGLFGLIETKVREMATDPDFHAKKLKVNFIGRTHSLPDSLQQAIQIAEEATQDYDSYTLNVAIAYAGRQEIADSCREHFREKLAQGIPFIDAIDSFSCDDIEANLYTAGQPPPDLLIRTSGEVRLSGFLLWQAAYAEYYFCNCLWPAFSRRDLLLALQSYDKRQRRYGK